MWKSELGRTISSSPHTPSTPPSSSCQGEGSCVWIFVDQWDIILGIMIYRLCESEPAGLHLPWHPWVGLLVPHPVSRFIHLVIASIQRRFVLPAKMHFIRHFHSNKLQQVYPKVLADFRNNQTMPRAHAVPISNFFTDSIDHNINSRIDIINASLYKTSSTPPTTQFCRNSK